ncbi:MAG: A/G-specific adenine glycosylase [Planctomyces sp.]|nr:A/G-specific adenine glycosylase [Planctomyces sp.]
MPDETAKSGWLAADVSTLRRRVLAWSKTRGRELPWRDVGDPYRVWISEVMLQQTTVAAVIPYYHRFLERFPDVAALAAADEQDVLAAWEGLGYYSRGRNLRRAAIAIQEQHAGRFPDAVDSLQQLPGIGRYTAGAIASFAFGRRAPIVEANTLRLFARLLGYEGDPRSSAGQAVLWGFAEEILPQRDIGRFNQALMDLGATVCTPAGPECGVCPLASVCRGLRAGRQEVIPRKPERPAVTVLHETAIALRRRGLWLVRRRGPGEWWAGLWDFPRLCDEPAGGAKSPATEASLERFAREWGLKGTLIRELAPASYSVTRFRVRARRIIAEGDSEKAGCGGSADGASGAGGDRKWATLEELETLPMTRSARLFARELKLGQEEAAAGRAPSPVRGGRRREAARD